MQAEVVRAVYRPGGEMRRLFKWLYGQEKPPDEVLIEGPGGTGKTRAIAEFLWHFCHWYPGARVLVVRKTRQSLSESWMVSFERDVVPPDNLIRKKHISRSHRTHYIVDKSEIALTGCDVWTRQKGTEYDIVLVEEATELAETEWEQFHRALRGKAAPFQLLIGSTNPDSPDHWLNLRCDAGLCERLVTTHADNPTVTPDYLRKLGKLSGVLGDRLARGLWRAAEGAVWPNFRRDVHVIAPPKVEKGVRRGKPDYEAFGIRRFVASIDWGYTDPCALGVWGIDGDGRLYLVAEIYRTGELHEWWAKRVAEFYAEFQLRALVCDPADREALEAMNKRLVMDHKCPALAIPADNAKHTNLQGTRDMTGLDLVREGFEIQGDGKPRIFFFHDALRFGPDPKLVEERQPTCTAKEIPAYVYYRDALGRLRSETTDPRARDHGCDMTRYMATWAWKKPVPDTSDRSKEIRPGTMAAWDREQERGRRAG